MRRKEAQKGIQSVRSWNAVVSRSEHAQFSLLRIERETELRQVTLRGNSNKWLDSHERAGTIGIRPSCRPPVECKTLSRRGPSDVTYYGVRQGIIG